MGQASAVFPSFFKDLFKRQVLQVLVGYIAACWSITQFVDWLVNRYALSPYLVDLWVDLSVLLLPTVLLLAYFRGEPGATPWTWAEKIGIPLNLILAAVILFAAFQGKELGAIIETVTIQDSSGSTRQRSNKTILHRTLWRSTLH
ncbi:hypothetical protein [Anthocerotibacter panamensis]|uniref:hypothetical protein n=1 Tax=Anthocerotibacter panamensis TaxID=2857077 RepID=UPI001C406540|nr:hypothetical protein [Anthocerotibacter panamensis]